MQNDGRQAGRQKQHHFASIRPSENQFRKLPRGGDQDRHCREITMPSKLTLVAKTSATALVVGSSK